jgi:gamma-glutamyltranspeptidase/glutathione hydrolase
MSYWHLEKDHVDVLEPGKRVRHTMNPVMVFKKASNQERKLVLVCGTPGADTQVQTNFQVISHVLDFGMNVVEAVEAPRWRSLQDGTESNYPHRVPDQLLLERRYSDDIRNALMIKGHDVKVIGDWAATGSEMMIYVDQDAGALHGGADPRRDGYSIGW